MGIISDYLEQTREKLGRFVDVSKFGSISTIPVSTGHDTPVLYECPLCGEVLPSNDQHKHMHDKHGNQHAYLRVNNKIINDYVFLEGTIKSMEAVVLGDRTASVIIRINNHPPVEIDISGTVSLTKHFSKFTDGEINVIMKISSIQKEYILYVNKLPSFNNKPIDQAALKYLFIPLSKREKPDYGSFTPTFSNPTYSVLENRYASGLHDYALAFQMVQEKEEAKEHFESALGCLRNFRTNFAITARRILALRMNCFSLLKDCDIRSRFYAANCFFNKHDSRFHIENKTGNIIQHDSEYGVYIDEFTEQFLECLEAFYTDDFVILDGLYTALQGIVSDKEKNNQDKLLLLSARTAYKEGNKVKKENYYRQLLGHPQFETEAEEMMK